MQKIGIAFRLVVERVPNRLRREGVESKIIIAETERLILRRYKEEDLQDLFEYVSDKEVVEYEPYKPLTINETKENFEIIYTN